MPFQAGRGITQGGPLSAKLFNVIVDAVAWEWLRELREGSACRMPPSYVLYKGTYVPYKRTFGVLDDVIMTSLALLNDC
jgi:hypothetical protein